jgi:putative SOS response-associated peptidase YedK
LTTVCSFSLLTMNADQHPLMKRFHRPKDEKRSLVIVPPEQRLDWLHADHRTARSLMQDMPVDEFYIEAAPRVSEARKHNLDLF